MAEPEITATDIAIVGMACRVPGAESARALWANVRAGVESIRRYSDEELRAAGVDEALLQNPNYVRAGGSLDGLDPARRRRQRHRAAGLRRRRVVGAGRRRRLAGGRSAGDREADDERAPSLDERLARELLLQHLGHGYFPPFAITAAAFWMAVRIRG